MDFSAGAILALWIANIAMAHGKYIKMTTHKGTVDLIQKGVSLARGDLLFSVSTCEAATLALSVNRKTVNSAPEYRLVINEKDGHSNKRRTVLYHWDKSQKMSKKVMVVEQTDNICKMSHWFYVVFRDNNFHLSDYCNKGHVFTWDSGVTERMRAAVISSVFHGNWAFVSAKDYNVKCPTHTGQTLQDFLSLERLVLETTATKTTKTVPNILFNFKSSGKILLSYQSCQKAYFLLSSSNTFKEYFALSLAHHDAQSKPISIILTRKVNGKKNVIIGSPMKSEDACQKPRTLHIYWSKDHIGAGSSCDPSSGREWSIDSKKELQFLAVNSIRGKESVKWTLAKDSCDVKYNHKNSSLSDLIPNKGISNSSQTSQRPTNNSFELTTSMYQSTVKQTTGKNPISSTGNPSTVLNTTESGTGNELTPTSGPRSKAPQLKIDIITLVALCYFLRE